MMSDKKPSVAVCFAGLPRLLSSTMPNWRAFKEKYSADVFVHTWEDPAINNERLRKTMSEMIEPTLMMIEPPRKINFDLYKDSDRIWPYRSSPVNVLSMWYSISKSIGLCDAWSQEKNKTYDIVCRARFDWWCEDIILENNPGLTVPDDPGLCGHRFTYKTQPFIAHNDQFGYGRPYVMREYAKTFDRVPWLFIEDGVDFCSELFLTANMLSQNIPVTYQKNMKYRIMK